MDVQFAPDLQAKLDQLSTATGRPQGEFVQDAMAGYFDDLEYLREMLNSRYDDIQSGKIQLMDGEEAFARLRAKSEARRSNRS